VPRRNSPRQDNLRRALAQDAARLMAENGIQDFLAAKRKAAARYGTVEAASLPSNSEIEAALAEHQRLFGAGTHEEQLVHQRSVAAEVMRRLANFQPRLVGAVLSGTATAHSDVQLHVFADSAESVSMLLMERGIEFEVTERRIRYGNDTTRLLPGLRFEQDRQSIDVTVFPLDGIRQAPASPVDGRPMRRADLAELRELLADQRSATIL
jgi:hypothetical protein